MKYTPASAVILIPSLEPDDRLPAYVRKLLERGFTRAVIVNDGSSEKYQPIFDELAAMDGVTVLKHEVNRGKGCGLKTGYTYIRDEIPQASGVITADADGQHTVEDVRRVSYGTEVARIFDTAYAAQCFDDARRLTQSIDALQQAQADGSNAGTDVNLILKQVREDLYGHIAVLSSGKYAGLEAARAELTFSLNKLGIATLRDLISWFPRKYDDRRSAKRIVILENVMNPTNVGAIFRSAAALGMEAVLLTPDCCDPLYRRAVRVSMGTVFQIPWTYIGQSAADWPEKGMAQLREMGFSTAAMALSHDTVGIADPCLKRAERLAVLLGTEGTGLSAETIAASDFTVKIPMFHGVDSLNVAAASAVAFWQLGRR